MLLNVEYFLGECDRSSIRNRVQPARGYIIAQVLHVQIWQLAFMQGHNQVVIALHCERFKILWQRQ